MMTSKQSIKRCISAPFVKLLSPTMKQKNIPEFVKYYKGAHLISYDNCHLIPETKIGVLKLVKIKHNKELELSFASDMFGDATWKCVLNQFNQLKRPRPNLLTIESYGITTLFKFNDALEAKSLYEAVEQMQSSVKVIHKSDIGIPTNFHQLDLLAWNNMRALKEVNQNTVHAKPCASNAHVKGFSRANAKENEKPRKLIKQKSIKNSFKTIISAAKDKKQHVTAHPERNPSEGDDDSIPLLL
uniref:CSON004161 protein n=1 Tax=Culicoides sonorensis TaxID=179676 RepID=A0A336MQN6_CULSO